MISPIHAMELEWIQYLHTFRTPFLDAFFRFWKFFDSAEFVLVLIPVVWYLHSRKMGVRLFYLIVLSAVINKILKITFGLPRPIHIDPNLTLQFSTSFGFPSGAAQTAVILPSLIILESKNKLYWIFGIIFGLFLSFSRVYLGMHFPSDLLGGFVVGAFLVWTYWKIFPKIERQWEKLFLWQKIVQVSLLPIIILAISLIPGFTFFIELSGITAGVGFGQILYEKWKIKDRYDVESKGIITRCFLTIWVIAGGFVKEMLWGPPAHQLLPSFILGLWISLIAPLVFTLANKKK